RRTLRRAAPARRDRIRGRHGGRRGRAEGPHPVGDPRVRRRRGAAGRHDDGHLEGRLMIRLRTCRPTALRRERQPREGARPFSFAPPRTAARTAIKIGHVTCLLTALMSALMSADAIAAPTADLVLRGGRVWAGKGIPDAAAIAVKDGRVLALGADAD